jgi:small subunit ribosomal protein S2
MSLVEDIIAHKVFLWHPKNHSNPKTSQFWAWVYNWWVVFNPDLVAERIVWATSLISDAKKNKKSILILWDKEVYKDDVVHIANNHNVMYMNYKIPAWVVSNNETILSMIKTLTNLESFCQSEDFNNLTKKEQSMKRRLLNKVKRVYAWVTWMKKTPDLIIIIDGQWLKKFVHECELLKTPSIVLCSSNFDLWSKLHVIPCNINSLKSISFVLNTILS